MLLELIVLMFKTWMWNLRYFTNIKYIISFYISYVKFLLFCFMKICPKLLQIQAHMFFKYSVLSKYYIIRPSYSNILNMNFRYTTF